MSPRVRAIIHDVANLHGVKVADMLGSCRTASLAHARFHAMHLIRRLEGPSYSLPDIARIFGKDHTSVLHGIRRWEQMPRPADSFILDRAEIMDEVESLEAKLRRARQKLRWLEDELEAFDGRGETIPVTKHTMVAA